MKKIRELAARKILSQDLVIVYRRSMPAELPKTKSILTQMNKRRTVDNEKIRVPTAAAGRTPPLKYLSHDSRYLDKPRKA